MKIKMSKKIVGGLTIGCLALSLGAVVLANDFQGHPPAREDIVMQAGMPDPQEIKQHIKDNLGNLVNAGTITQEQADKVLKFFDQKDLERKAKMDKIKNMNQDERQAYFEEHHKNHPDFISELKAAAGLSDEQAKAVAEAVRPPHFGHPPMSLQFVSDSLNRLVSENTITQDQADSILSFFKEKDAQRKAEMEKIKNMNQDERQAYFKEHHKKHLDLINDLKTAAGLSDEQAKAVAEAVRPPHFGPPPISSQFVSDTLNRLVSENKITQDQADSILSFFKEKDAERKTEMDKIKNMSPEERHTYFEEHCKNHPDFISDIKAAAGLSDEQAQVVRDALRPPHGPFPGAPMPNP